ncbi:dTDP-4-dehydrorhamnose 3,5-epimerase family protein [Amycolatopsis magusensis]|uniref:dTDP-4-dehydrorhamnose 3,5-epimerase family protein n=1 Tax=Amycolatopsis magusensis TaxID=882444 RepID=UPI00378E0C47
MQMRALAVDGAFEFSPKVYPDDRGFFVSPFQEDAFRDAVGHPSIPVAQTNHSMSRRGVIRGVHYTVTPPGVAKHVYCARGRALDIVVDTRVGSPTFGRSEAVLFDQQDFRSVYFPVGVGHAFIALEDETVMSYLLTSAYVPKYELSISIFDPALQLSIPDGIDGIQSQRDTVAPTLDEARLAGLLPDYETCRQRERALWRQ